MENPAYLDFMYIFFGEHLHTQLSYYLEVIFRMTFLFGLSVFAIHFLYQKETLEFTPSELVILFAFGTTIGDAILYRSVPLAHCMIAIGITIFWAKLMSYVAKKSERFENFVLGKPILIIHEGKIIEEAINAVNLPKPQLLFILRLNGIKHTSEIEYAFVEGNGKTSVIKYNKNKKKQKEGMSTIDQHLPK